jgi:hypothetical protein
MMTPVGHAVGVIMLGNTHKVTDIPVRPVYIGPMPGVIQARNLERVKPID